MSRRISYLAVIINVVNFILFLYSYSGRIHKDLNQ